MAEQYRIVSLCPSTTFHLIDLGLADHIIGRTKFCIEPKHFIESIPKVGGTKSPKFEIIRSLKPSHIMFNREENDMQQLAEIQSIAETIITTPTDIKTSLDQNDLFGKIFNCEPQTKQIETNILLLLERLQSKPHQSFTYLYFIWNDPYMVAGTDTYIDKMFSLINGRNAVAEISDERYPTVTADQITSLSADTAFLSSEPFPFKEKHIDQYQFAAKTIQLIDGQALSWHGSYMRIGLEYLLNHF